MKSTSTLSIVAATLAATLLAGGVEIRAEPGARATPLERSSSQIRPGRDMCLEQPPDERTRRAFLIERRGERRAGGHVVPLNTRGFNHGALELPVPASPPVPASSAR